MDVVGEKWLEVNSLSAFHFPYTSILQNTSIESVGLRGVFGAGRIMNDG